MMRSRREVRIWVRDKRAFSLLDTHTHSPWMATLLKWHNSFRVKMHNIRLYVCTCVMKYVLRPYAIHILRTYITDIRMFGDTCGCSPSKYNNTSNIILQSTKYSMSQPQASTYNAIKDNKHKISASYHRLCLLNFCLVDPWNEATSVLFRTLKWWKLPTVETWEPRK